MRLTLILTAILATALMLFAVAASAVERDQLTIDYPADAGQVLAVLTYANAAAKNSKGGEHTVDTRYGPIVVRIVIGDGPETLVVLDWPASLWPHPHQVDVVDGEEGEIQFLAPMS